MNHAVVTVEEYTTPDPVSVEETLSLDDLLQVMTQHGVRHLPVTRHGELVGVISDRDVRLFVAMPAAERLELTAGDIMTEAPIMIDADMPLEDAALLMSERKVGSLIVREGNELLGIFTATDALNALIEVLRETRK